MTSSGASRHGVGCGDREAELQRFRINRGASADFDNHACDPQHAVAPGAFRHQLDYILDERQFMHRTGLSRDGREYRPNLG